MTRQQPNVSKSGLTDISNEGSAYRKQKYWTSNICIIDTRDEPSAKERKKPMDDWKEQDYFEYESRCSTSSSNKQSSSEDSSDSDWDRPNIQKLIDEFSSGENSENNSDVEG